MRLVAIILTFISLSGYLITEKSGLQELFGGFDPPRNAKHEMKEVVLCGFTPPKNF